MKNFYIVFESDIKQIRDVVKNAQVYVAQCIPEISSDELFEIRLILSELLINAVTHGNKNDPHKTVKICIEAEENTVKGCVIDQGEGFDFLNASCCKAPSTEEHGRGISLVRGLVDFMDIKLPGNKIFFKKRVNCNV